MKKNIFVTLGAVAVLLIASLIIITNGLSDGKNVVLNDIDLTRISDGSYTGTYEHGRWTNSLTVHVENNRIIGIDLDKDVFASGITDCSEEVFRRVIENQGTQIDAVAGATVTTNAYLKAIEDALRN